MIRSQALVTSGLLVVAAAWSTSTAALAAPARRAPSRLTAHCTVHIIHGLKRPGPFPAALKGLRTRLAGQPFQQFRSFKLLKKTDLPLATGRLTRKSLVGPYRFEGQLMARLTTARRKARLKFQLSLYRRRTGMTATKRLLRTTLVLDRGGTMFLAGPRYRNGRLIFSLTCR